MISLKTSPIRLVRVIIPVLIVFSFSQAVYKAEPAYAKDKSSASKKADPALKSVHESYSKGNYREALNKLANMPQTDMTHYYAGLSYQGLNQLSSAASEYQWVATYSKNERLRTNAQSALSTVQRYASRRTYSGNGNNFARVAAATHAPAAKPTVRRG